MGKNDNAIPEDSQQGTTELAKTDDRDLGALLGQHAGGRADLLLETIYPMRSQHDTETQMPDTVMRKAFHAETV